MSTLAIAALGAAQNRPAQNARINADAAKFEAMAIGQMLKPMFEGVAPPDAPFGGGAAETTWRPFLIDALAKQFEARGGLGLAPAIAQEMSATPAHGKAVK